MGVGGLALRTRCDLLAPALPRAVVLAAIAVIALSVGLTGTAEASPATAISAGYDFVCARTVSGEEECWGLNFYGELGNGLTNEDWSPTRYPVVGLTGVVAVSSTTNSESHSCALIVGGTVKCWGANFSGDLGDGTDAYRKTPVAVAGLNEVTAVGAGGFHSCALITNGTVECWGSNIHAQLGDGTNSFESLTPVPVSGLSDAIAIGTGYTSTCAVRDSGELDCWGDNFWGQIGIGVTESHVPVAVPGISAASEVSVGEFHSCALGSNGQVLCWGEGGEGELGDPNFPFTEESPVTVPGITDAVQVVVGQAHSCALLAGGTVKCWGDNLAGQLGVTGIFKSASPVPVPGLSTVTEIAAGVNFTCALLADGEVVCWGGDFGRLPTTGAEAPGGSPPGGGSTGAKGSAPGPPIVRITSHPPRETTVQTAEFKFAGVAGGAYECSIDAGSWSGCRSSDSFGPLDPGDHRFSVRETLKGVTGPADSYAWTIDLPRACVLKVARARVFAFTHQRKARLVIHYKAYKPARVKVSYSLNGAHGALALGAASARFKTAGIFRLDKKLGASDVEKLRGASSMKVRFSIPQAPTSCSRYYTKLLTIPKKVFGQTVWFQSDSQFGPEAK